jgi:NADP-dependent 3-hydroxy acid dehydrogenase YdfG
MTADHTVVIGAGPGLGAAYARRFLADGGTVTLLSRSPGPVGDLGGDATATPAGLVHRSVDAADDDALMAALADAAARSPITTLVYNAVRAHRAPISSLGVAELRDELRTGVEAAWLAIATVLPSMTERGRGAVVVTGGGAATHPLGGAGFLSPTKAALRMLVLALADDLGGGPVRVGTVTVAGRVDPESGIHPDRVADALAAIVAGDAGPEVVIA